MFTLRKGNPCNKGTLYQHTTLANALYVSVRHSYTLFLFCTGTSIQSWELLTQLQYTPISFETNSSI